MSKHKDPKRKKQDSYEKDFVNFTEDIHLFRKLHPKVKSCVNRRFRRKLNNTVSILSNSLDYVEDESIVYNVKKDDIDNYRFGRSSPLKLRDHVKVGLEKRIEFNGWNYFKKKRFDKLTDEKKESFIKFITSLCSEKGIIADKKAKFYKSIFTNNETDLKTYSCEYKIKHFLLDFFKINPEIEKLFYQWIDLPAKEN